MGELLNLIDDAAAAFLADRHRLARLRAPVDELLWDELVAMGFAAICLGESDGGSGMGAAGAIRLARRFGAALLPEPFAARAVAPAVIASALPAGEVRRAIVESLTSGQGSFALAWQETAEALAPWPGMTTTQGGLVRGGKILVPTAATLLVTATDGEEPCLLVIDANDVAQTLQEDLAGGRIADLSFDGSTRSGEPILRGAEAALITARALNLATLTTAAQLLGLIDSLLAMTTDHLKLRNQFGQPIGAFQALQHRAVDLYMARALTEASVLSAAARFDAEPDHSTTIAAISAAKARAADTVDQASREAIQMHGAIGFTEESDVGLFVRAGLGLVPRFGTALAHRTRFALLEDGQDD